MALPDFHFRLSRSSKRSCFDLSGLTTSYPVPVLSGPACNQVDLNQEHNAQTNRLADSAERYFPSPHTSKSQDPSGPQIFGGRGPFPLPRETAGFSRKLPLDPVPPIRPDPGNTGRLPRWHSPGPQRRYRQLFSLFPFFSSEFRKFDLSPGLLPRYTPAPARPAPPAGLPRKAPPSRLPGSCLRAPRIGSERSSGRQRPVDTFADRWNTAAAKLPRRLQSPDSLFYIPSERFPAV